VSRQDAKRRRDAQRRAESRRRSLEHKLDGSEMQGLPRLPQEPPMRSLADVEAESSRRPARRQPLPWVASLVVVTGVVLTVLGVLFAVSGGTPVFSGSWEPAQFGWLVLPVVGAVAVIRSWSRVTTRTKVAAVALAVVTFTSFTTGSLTQIVVDGQVQLRGSVGDRTYRLAKAVLADMLVLEENQRLLELPSEQARGVFDLYAQAAAQSGGIAARWNPAIAGEVPLPGFVSVFDKLNKAADLQAQALLLYADDLQQPDPARLQRVVAARTRISELLTGDEGAVKELGSTIAPLGISLTVENGVVR